MHLCFGFFLLIKHFVTCFALRDAQKQGEQLIIPNGLLLVAHEPSFVNTALGPHIRGNTLRAYSIGKFPN